MPVYLYLRMEQLGSHWKDFCEILYLSFPRKYVETFPSFIKIQQELRVLYMKTFSHLW
jgi:hypothetical protein